MLSIDSKHSFLSTVSAPFVFLSIKSKLHLTVAFDKFDEIELLLVSISLSNFSNEFISLLEKLTDQVWLFW